MNDNTHTPENSKIIAIKRMAKGIADIFLGVADDADHPTANRQSKVSGEAIRPKTAPREQVIVALNEAIAQFYTDEVLPYRKYSDSEATVYQVSRVSIIETLDNLGLVAEFGRLNREQRVRMARAQFKQFEHFDLSAFTEVRIEKAETGDNDPVYVLAGEGPTRARIAFEFYGDFVDRVPAAKPEPTLTNPAVHPSQTATLLAIPTASTLPAKPKADAAIPATLHIAEPGQAARTLTLQKFPARIGRSEECDVVLTHAYVSRIHLTIIQHAETGALAIIDHAVAGTLLDGISINHGTEAPLTKACTLSLASESPLGAATILVELPFPKTIAMPPIETQPSRIATIACARQETPLAKTASPTLRAAPTLLARAQPTLLARDADIQPIARLTVKHADGRKETHPITALPFEIGREPDGVNNYQAQESAAKVSRQHIRISRAKEGGFAIQNLAVKANGCWAHGEKLSENFTVAAVSPANENGWIVLGERSLSGNSIAVRIERLT